MFLISIAKSVSLFIGFSSTTSDVMRLDNIGCLFHFASIVLKSLISFLIAFSAFVLFFILHTLTELEIGHFDFVARTYNELWCRCWVTYGMSCWRKCLPCDWTVKQIFAFSLIRCWPSINVHVLTPQHNRFFLFFVVRSPSLDVWVENIECEKMRTSAIRNFVCAEKIRSRKWIVAVMKARNQKIFFSFFVRLLLSIVGNPISKSFVCPCRCSEKKSERKWLKRRIAPKSIADASENSKIFCLCLFLLFALLTIIGNLHLFVARDNRINAWHPPRWECRWHPIRERKQTKDKKKIHADVTSSTNIWRNCFVFDFFFDFPFRQRQSTGKRRMSH